MNYALLERLPNELKERRQWVIAGSDGSPCVVGVNGLKRTTIHARQEWYQFQEAIHYAKHFHSLVGFILTEEDPFTVIDLDVVDAESQMRKGKPVDKSKWTTTADHERYRMIMQAFPSFSEISRSGKGVHIWLFGNIGKGVRRDNIEVYSQERFIICTGNVCTDAPIIDGGQNLAQLVGEMRHRRDAEVVLVEHEEEYSDQEIVERLMDQENGEKFTELCKGNWSAYNFPSQSEADLALMSMFTFYSKSNEQCRRLFLMTGLGKREKCTPDYMNRMLKVIRARQERESLETSAAESLARELVNEIQSALADTTPAELATHEARIPESDGGLTWPPGMVGAIAAFIYNSSPRPVKEVAIVAALGLVAGICGKAWHIPQSGLNLYIILVARSAVGKESMHSGISMIMSKLREAVPQAMQFVDFNDFASGQALVKACAANPCFLNVSGEWGRKLKRLSNDAASDGPIQGLRTVMTNLYQKSGPASTVGGLSYSNKDSNVASVSGVAYSMIGETTPGTFYESLTESMMEDGFMSRFTIIEYTGERPPMNRSIRHDMDANLAEALANLCTHSLTLLSRYANQLVEFSHDAKSMMDAFDLKCDQEINNTVEESWRQMWNRAHLKACRIAALLAVADNWINPVVERHHAEWALQVVLRDIGVMTNRIMSGDIGNTDAAREKKLLKIIAEYLTTIPPSSYGIPESLRSACIVPRKYMLSRTNSVQCFVNSRHGSTIALDQTIKSLVDAGYLIEASKATILEHGVSGRCFIVADKNIVAAIAKRN